MPSIHKPIHAAFRYGWMLAIMLPAAALFLLLMLRNLPVGSDPGLAQKLLALSHPAATYVSDGASTDGWSPLRLPARVLPLLHLAYNPRIHYRFTIAYEEGGRTSPYEMTIVLTRLLRPVRADDFTVEIAADNGPTPARPLDPVEVINILELQPWLGLNAPAFLGRALPLSPPPG